MRIVRTLGLLSVMILVACGPRESLVAPVARGFAEPADVRDISLLNDGEGVRYDEAVSGDLLGSIESAIWRGGLRFGGAAGLGERVFLRPGVNLIKGSTYVATFAPGVDPDAFTVTVPRGMELLLDETEYSFDSMLPSGNGRIAFLGIGVNIRDLIPESADREDVSVQGGQGNGRGNPPVHDNLLLFSSSQLLGGVEGLFISPRPLRFFRVVNNSVDENLPVRFLPAGQYTFSFGGSWAHTGFLKLSWNYMLSLVMAPAR